MKQFIKQHLADMIRGINQRGVLSGPVLRESYWGLAYHQGDLCFNDRPLKEAAAQWGTPLHIYFEERLKANLDSFQRPGCEVFLSYKTNPVPKMLGFLHSLGAGAEVISEYELWLATKLGVPPEKIIYNGPAKSDRSLSKAIELGILAINLNHAEEIPRIRRLAKLQGKRVRVGIRVGGTGWAGQFGFALGDGKTLKIIETLQNIPEFDLAGLHCHRGISIRTPKDLDQHVEPILDFCHQAYQRWGWTPRILDLGGSLGIPSVRTFTEKDRRLAGSLGLPPPAPDPNLSLKPLEFAARIVAKVTEASKKIGGMPKVVIEPGRSLTGDGQLMLTQVVDVKSARPLDYGIMDAGGCHARIMESEFHQILPLTQEGGGKQAYRLVGPICHMGDVLARVWYGHTLSPGDLLAVMDSGAYFIADSAAFSFPRAGVATLTLDNTWDLARSVEDFAHMVALDHF